MVFPRFAAVGLTLSLAVSSSAELIPLREFFRNPERDGDSISPDETRIAFLVAASPALQVEWIKAPLLVAQGRNDPRVNTNESNQMVAALPKRGIPVPYLINDDEGHGFQNEENRFDFYRAMKQYFARHLGGAREDHPDVLAGLLNTPAPAD